MTSSFKWPIKHKLPQGISTGDSRVFPHGQRTLRLKFQRETYTCSLLSRYKLKVTGSRMLPKFKQWVIQTPI